MYRNKLIDIKLNLLIDIKLNLVPLMLKRSKKLISYNQIHINCTKFNFMSINLFLYITNCLKLMS